MRTTFATVVIVGLLSVTPAFAGAENANTTVSKHHYDTCSCRFGYGSVCLASAACDSVGGRCAGSCTVPPNTSLTNR